MHFSVVLCVEAVVINSYQALRTMEMLQEMRPSQCQKPKYMQCTIQEKENHQIYKGKYVLFIYIHLFFCNYKYE